MPKILLKMLFNLLQNPTPSLLFAIPRDHIMTSKVVQPLHEQSTPLSNSSDFSVPAVPRYYGVAVDFAASGCKIYCNSIQFTSRAVASSHKNRSEAVF